MTKLAQEMEELSISPTVMLKRINLIAERDLREEAKMLSRDRKKQEEYIAEHKRQKSRGNHGINATVGMTRKTLYNAMHGSGSVSGKSASLILQVINETRVSRGMRKVTLDDLGMTVFKRWER